MDNNNLGEVGKYLLENQDAIFFTLLKMCCEDADFFETFSEMVDKMAKEITTITVKNSINNN